MKKICIVTGTRAEWGLLSGLARKIKHDKDFELQIIATNMHLKERFGMTYKEIEEDGFSISYRVPMDVEGKDNAATTVKEMGVAMSGFAEAFDTLKPDILVVLGDRYEILCAVSAALIFKIPVAHLHGGEITEGAYDDAIRHAITKMSHLHFTSTQDYRQRVIQMGEQPQRVFNVGAIGVDNIKQIKLWSKEETEASLDNFKLDKNTILVTYHPVTLGNNSAENQIDNLLNALNNLPQFRIIFTMPNSDTGSLIIETKIKKWCADNSQRSIWFTSLGLNRYLSVLQYIGCVVGNSSSGIIEVPSFNIPTLNIGDRQKGRVCASSVFSCSTDSKEIESKILEVSSNNITFISNPYEKVGTLDLIYEQLKTNVYNELDTIKKFYDQKC